MKKKYYILTFFIAFFCLILQAYAEESYVILNDSLYIRKSPTTANGYYKLGQIGEIYKLKNNNLIADTSGSCSNGWYEIEYNGSSAYVCSNYVNVSKKDVDLTEPTTACQAQMKEAGFPSSYWNDLCSLKEKHPTWKFIAIDTKIDWPTAVDKFTSCGNSLVDNPKSEWIDKACTISEGSFKSVNQTGVAYYLDPRNFLNEVYIFQFESTKYNESIENNYANAAKSIISKADFYKYHLAKNEDISVYLKDAGKETNVNPIHLASRMRQELGTGTRLQNLYKGVFNGVISYAPVNPEVTKEGATEDEKHTYDFRGFYNFYNIGVSGACVRDYGSTYCGLTYAKNEKRNWNTVYKAVKGGGDLLSGEYINMGQYNAYLERFNVVPTKSNWMYGHFYMANLGGPSSEATTEYNAYKGNNLLESPFEFHIPVYNNMGATIINSSDVAKPDPEEPSKPSESVLEPNAIVTTAGYKTSSDYISGIEIGKTASEIKSSLESIAGANNITITNSVGKAVTNEKIGTGFKIKVSNGKTDKTYTAIIKGDTSGDGVINALDLLQVQKSILGTYSLKDAYKLAGDTSGDGTINALDLLQVQKDILGTYKVEQ